ncbi:CapA family protein [Streptomyces sp. NPDC098789]|uniref:CapA family protein n=1 Tax=Streptomyces sp. NPDC098789 TaxID=3366098 RepID=UPI00382F96E2
MRTSAKITTGVAGLALVAGGVYAVPRLLDDGGRPAAAQRLGGGAPEPGRSGAITPPGGRPFTLVATGDIIPYPSIIERSALDAGGDGHDFRKILGGVKAVVSAADMAVCHHEIPYGEPGGPYTGYPTFKAPHELADALKDTGYDSCSTASNHTLDAGYPGLARTLDHLDRVGIKHSGSARGAAEATTPVLFEAGGAKVAQLSYTYGTNGIPVPEGKPWSVNLIDQRRIIADARAARAAGANVVVLSVHWGTEWQTAPNEQQLELARALTASRTEGGPDLDLILGTHNHVPQPYEKVNGTWVAPTRGGVSKGAAVDDNGTWVIYGMGDQVAGEMFNHTGARDLRGNMSSLGRFRFEPPTAQGQRWRVTKAEFVPLYFDTDAGRVVDLRKADGVLADVRDEISHTVLGRDAGKHGLTIAE